MPADISIDFEVHVHGGYRLLLLKDPLQSHVVEWEKASRRLKNEDAKPLLTQAINEFRKIRVGESTLNEMISIFVTASEVLKNALQILEDNETLTLSSNRGVMVKAALEAGWIASVEKLPQVEGAVPQVIMATPEEVDSMKPWLVHWIAERVATVYLEATTIPKNS